MASGQTPTWRGDPRAFVTTVSSRKFMSPRRSPTHNTTPSVCHRCDMVWRGCGVAARHDRLLRVSNPYFMPILLADAPGFQTENPSIYLARLPLSARSKWLWNSSLARVYFFPHWFVSSLRPRSPSPFEIIVIARTNDLINHPLALRHRASGFKSSLLIVSMVQPKYIMGFNIVEELHMWRRCSLERIAWCISYTVHG